MKPITYALLAAAAACGLAGAQTAYTTPVGYVSVTTPANADTTVSACLNRAPELQTVATSASGSTLTLKAADIAANAFAFAPPSQPKTYYVKFLDGSLVGQYQTIDSNLASNDNGTPSDKTDDFVVLTLESPVVITGTPSVVVAPHWTLNTLFPGGAGVGTTTDPTEASALVLRQDQASNGINRAPNKSWVYFVDSAPAPNASGWYDFSDLGAGIQNDQVLYPDEFYLIRNLTAAPVVWTISGEVPKASPSTTLVKSAAMNDNYLSVPVPVDMTLVESGLLQSGAYTPTTDPTEAVDSVLLYSDSAAGINKAATKTYIYFSDPSPAPNASGWYDFDNLGDGPQDSVKLLKAGNGFIVRKAAGTAGSIPWTSPLPYTLPN